MMSLCAGGADQGPRAQGLVQGQAPYNMHNVNVWAQRAAVDYVIDGWCSILYTLSSLDAG